MASTTLRLVRGSIDAASTMVNNVKNALQTDKRLFVLIENNSPLIGELKNLIQKVKDINVKKQTTGDTCLHISALKGNFEVTKLLVESGAKIDFPNKNGQTPAQLAAQANQSIICDFLNTAHMQILSKKNTSEETKLESLRRYMDQGFSKNAKNKDGKTLLDLAIQYNYIKIAKFLVEEIHVTISIQDSETMKFLSEMQVDFNIQDQDGKTFLHHALEQKDLETAKLLMKKRNFKIDVQDKDGRTPLHIAVQNGDTKLVQAFVARDDRVDINVQDKDGRTPLHIAVQNGNEELMKLLIREDRIKINLSDKDGRTSIHIAVQNDNEELVKLLVKIKDIDLNAQDKNGNTPVHIVVQNGRRKSALLKEDVKINVNLQDNLGRTPLHIAVQKGNLEMVKFLIETMRAKETIKDAKNKIPFRYAAKHEIADYLKMPFHRARECNRSLGDVLALMDAGFNINEKDENGCTALHKYVLQGNAPCVQMFFGNCYADKALPNNKRETPLQSALSLAEQCETCLTQVNKEEKKAEMEDLKKEKEEIRNPIVQILKSPPASPLHIALLRDTSIETIKSLMSEENLHSKDPLGNSPWHIAVMRGNVAALYLLYQLSKDNACAENNAGETPAHILQFKLDLIPNDKKADITNFFHLHKDLKPAWMNFGSLKEALNVERQKKLKQEKIKQARVRSGNLKDQIDKLTQDIEKLKSKGKTPEISIRISEATVKVKQLEKEVDSIMQEYLLYEYDAGYFVQNCAEKLSSLALFHLGISLPETSFPSLADASNIVQRPFNALYNAYMETSFSDIQLPSLPTLPADFESATELAKKPFHYLYDVYQNIPSDQIMETLSPNPVQKMLISITALHMVSAGINTLVRAHFTMNAFPRRILSDVLSTAIVISSASYFWNVSLEQMGLYIAGSYAVEIISKQVIFPVGRLALQHFSDFGSLVYDKIFGVEEPEPALKIERTEKK